MHNELQAVLNWIYDFYLIYKRGFPASNNEDEVEKKNSMFIHNFFSSSRHAPNQNVFLLGCFFFFFTIFHVFFFFLQNNKRFSGVQIRLRGFKRHVLILGKWLLHLFFLLFSFLSFSVS